MSDFFPTTPLDITHFFLFLTLFFSVSHSSLPPGTTQSAKQRSCWDTQLSSVCIIFMPVPQKISHPSIVVLLSLLSLNTWWFNGFLRCLNGFFVYSWLWYRWFSWRRVREREGGKRHSKKTMLCFAILMQLDLEWKLWNRDSWAVGFEPWKRKKASSS